MEDVTSVSVKYSSPAGRATVNKASQ